MMKLAEILGLAISLCVVFQDARAQDTTWIEKIRARRQEKIDEGKFMITPLVAPGYSPELKFLFAAGGLISFKTNREDSIIQRSSLPVIFGISTTGAIIANADIKTFWIKDRIRFNTEIWYKDMPDHYFGVGYYDAYHTSLGDSTTKYQRQWFWVNTQLKIHIRRQFFVGLNIDFNGTYASLINPVMRSDPNFIEYGANNFNSGLGILIEYDSRDNVVIPWKGLYINLMATCFGKYFGGDNVYQVYQFDARYYRNIFSKGKTLAFQLYGRFATPGVPYGEMSKLGSPFNLRGYRWGRYRDRSMVFMIAEYRHIFWRKKKNDLSRFGFVVWAGTGSVGKDMSDYVYWLPNAGVGLRFELQPRMNLRLDLGFGEKALGAYFQFNEAF